MGCLEENIIGAVADASLEALTADPEIEKTGMRQRTIALRAVFGVLDDSATLIEMPAGVFSWPSLDDARRALQTAPIEQEGDGVFIAHLDVLVIHRVHYETENLPRDIRYDW